MQSIQLIDECPIYLQHYIVKIASTYQHLEIVMYFKVGVIFVLMMQELISYNSNHA